MSTVNHRETVTNLLNASAEARDNVLMEQARLEFPLGEENGLALDRRLASEIVTVSTRIRNLGQRSLKSTIMNLGVVRPTEIEEHQIPFLRISDVCTTEAKILDDVKMVDGFSVYTLKDAQETRDALFILRQATDIETGVRRNVGSFGMVVGNKNSHTPELKVQSLGDRSHVAEKALFAVNTLNQFTKKYPWLSGFHMIPSDHGTDLQLGIKMDGQFSTLQTLVGGDSAERHRIVEEINGIVSSANVREYDEEESKYLALGVLTSLRKQLKIK